MSPYPAVAIDVFLCDRHSHISSGKMMPDVAHTSIVQFYGKMRERITSNWSDIVLEEEVDGVINVIEIDESLFWRRHKYNHGQRTKWQWVFGMVERNSRKTYFQCVDSRDKEILTSIITKHAVSGCTIHHDWAAYRHLKEEGFEHGTVVHTKEFKSKDRVCTNN